MQRHAAVVATTTALAMLNSAFTATASQAQEVHPVERVIGLLHGLITKVESEGQTEEVSFGRFQHWCGTSSATLQQAITGEQAEVDRLQNLKDALAIEQSTLNKHVAGLEEQIVSMQASGSKSEGQRNNDTALYTEADRDRSTTIAALAEAITELENARDAVGLVPLELTQVLKIVDTVVTPSESRDLLAAALAGQDVRELVTSSRSRSGRAPRRRLLRGSESQAIVPDVFHLLGRNTSSDTENASSTSPRPENASSASPHPEPEAVGDYERHIKKYSFKSDRVIELLKDLLLRLRDERSQGTVAETNAVNAYALSKNARDAAILAAQSSKGEKDARLGELQHELVAAEADLQGQKGELQADESSLASTKQNCEKKQREWTERSGVREQEIEAMRAAIDVMAKVARVRTEPPSNPLLPHGASAFLIQVAGASSPEDPRARVVGLLRAAARTAHSKALEHLALEIRSTRLTGGHFDEVINMIQKMLFRLMDEQQDEDRHKAWCDLELEKSNTSQADKEDKVEELSARIAAAESKVRLLEQDIAAASAMIASFATFEAEATEIRKAGKNDNAVAIKDAEEAQTAIARAQAIIETFYKGTGMLPKQPWELLLQGGSRQRLPFDVVLPESPVTWDASYAGVANPTNQPDGILAILTRVAADFAKMEADTRAQEAMDQKDYDEQMHNAAVEKARRSQEVEERAQEKKRLLGKITSSTASRKHTTSELDAITRYIRDLQPACVDGDSTYDDRREARTGEIAALKHAQELLTNYANPKNSSVAPGN